MAEFQGHKNYSYWNVAKWLYDDQGYYAQATNAVKSLVDKDKAARYLLETLPVSTPDSVRFTFRNIRAALKDLDT